MKQLIGKYNSLQPLQYGFGCFFSLRSVVDRAATHFLLLQVRLARHPSSLIIIVEFKYSLSHLLRSCRSFVSISAQLTIVAMMKYASVAWMAAAISQTSMVSASPHKISKIDLSDILTLGGMTFKIHQTPNKGFSGLKRGPLAIARAYTKFGVSYPDDLQSVLEQLLEELGLSKHKGKNSTTVSGQGMKNS